MTICNKQSDFLMLLMIMMNKNVYLFSIVKQFCSEGNGIFQALRV